MAGSFLLPFLLFTAMAMVSVKGEGYKYGEPVPVTCLNRTIDTGEHIRDGQGNLQYVPFPTCKETSSPLAIPYGVSKIVSCTIDPISDQLYHLLEYYIHNDAPLACRVPTGPLVPSTEHTREISENVETNSGKDEYTIVDDNGGPSYTPLTIALQGTLQLSHVHLWTDINMIMHCVGTDDVARLTGTKPKKMVKNRNKASGYVVAGIAYSLPELGGPLHSSPATSASKSPDERETRREQATLVLEDARNPWTEGHGSKVVRGEQLQLKFRVSWVTGTDSLGWTGLSFSPVASASSAAVAAVGGIFSSLFFFIIALMIGAVAALLYERVVVGGPRGRYGVGRWRGEGILGRPLHTSQAFSHARRGSGITYGSGGRSNGYGGFMTQSWTHNNSEGSHGGGRSGEVSNNKKD